MKTDIVLAGVGGQGILSIATILGAAALKEDLHLKQAEVHGMSQRGGDVQSNLRLSSNPIASDLIPLGGADLIVSLEP
ncbi:MAG: 2-oxoacid:acceptor oxidoreductase family protein, partial [Muribaculaceae bacterium]|nr:2-oxoacid:acceptor oxidoreductase family protein [Muribaculaceae bacterium]